jgi:uncharacterized protein (TIGR02145 family)
MVGVARGRHASAMFARSLALAWLTAALFACSSPPSPEGAPGDAPADAPAAPLPSASSAASPSASAEAGSPPPAELVDARDGQRYPVVAIGGARWLGKNLAYAAAGSYCYDDAPASCERDGRLYTFASATTACPATWHLPSDDEWKALERALGMAPAETEREGYDVARGTDQGTQFKAGPLEARMAGFRTGTTYEAAGDRAYFWTSTRRGQEVWRRRITAAAPTIFRFTNPTASFAISVRCVEG